MPWLHQEYILLITVCLEESSTSITTFTEQIETSGPDDTPRLCGFYIQDATYNDCVALGGFDFLQPNWTTTNRSGELSQHWRHRSLHLLTFDDQIVFSVTTHREVSVDRMGICLLSMGWKHSVHIVFPFLSLQMEVSLTYLLECQKYTSLWETAFSDTLQLHNCLAIGWMRVEFNIEFWFNQLWKVLDFSESTCAWCGWASSRGNGNLLKWIQDQCDLEYGHVTGLFLFIDCVYMTCSLEAQS